MKLLAVLFATTALISTQTGCVPLMAAGATATGYTVAQERSVGDAIDDATIETQISSYFLQEDVNDLFKNVSVESVEGRVLLTGAVKKPETRVEATRLAWKPQGVKEVINELQISDEATIEDIANDTWITTQIRGKLIVTKDVRSLNYTIDTVNGVVYLIGIAQNQRELEKVSEVASQVKGVKKVINHVRLKTDPLRN